MRLEVGKIYATRSGGLVRVLDYYPENMLVNAFSYRVERVGLDDTVYHLYFNGNAYKYGDSGDDISDFDEYTEPLIGSTNDLMNEILKLLKLRGYTDFDTEVNDFGGGNDALKLEIVAFKKK